MQKCPIYNSYNACSENRDCLFNRSGGCALVLAATIAEENEKKLKQLSADLSEVKSYLYSIESKVNKIN